MVLLTRGEGGDGPGECKLRSDPISIKSIIES